MQALKGRHNRGPSVVAGGCLALSGLGLGVVPASPGRCPGLVCRRPIRGSKGPDRGHYEFLPGNLARPSWSDEGLGEFTSLQDCISMGELRDERGRNALIRTERTFRFERKRIVRQANTAIISRSIFDTFTRSGNYPMRLVPWAAAAIVSVSLVGCGDSSSAGKAGIPEDALNKPPPPIPGVDLSKGSLQNNSAKKAKPSAGDMPPP